MDTKISKIIKQKLLPHVFIYMKPLNGKILFLWDNTNKMNNDVRNNVNSEKL